MTEFIYSDSNNEINDKKKIMMTENLDSDIKWWIKDKWINNNLRETLKIACKFEYLCVYDSLKYV